MPKLAPLALALTLGAAMTAAGQAKASTGDGFMPLGNRTIAPVGFMVYCAHNAAECGAPPAPQTPAADEAVETSAAPDLAALDLTLLSPASFTSATRGWSLGDLEAGLREEAVLTPPPAPAAQEAPEAEPAAPQRLEYSKDNLRLLARVNDRVNRAVKPGSDLALTGAPETWSLPTLINGRLYGDCEDYALMKKQELIAAGVPRAALSLAVAVTKRGESHAVLLVETDKGEVVLDNLSAKIRPWAKAPYQWRSRQISGLTGDWVRIGA